MHVIYGRGSVLLWQGDEIPRVRAVWGFSSPLTMRCTSYYLGPTQKRQPIQMPFGIITRVPRRCHVLDGAPDHPRGRGNFGENVAAHCKVKLMGHSTMSCAKSAEPIDVPCWTKTRVGPRNHVLDGGPDPPKGSDNFNGRRVGPL